MKNSKKSNSRAARPLNDTQRQLVVNHAALARNLSHRYAEQGRSRGITVGDLEQEACMGLCVAAQQFDGRQGASFQTYAYAWCRKFILTAIGSAPDTATGDAELLEGQPDDDAEPGELLHEAHQLRVRQLLSVLQPIERRVVCLRFGIKPRRPAKPLDFTQVALKLHLNPTRVRHLYDQALLKMEFSVRELY